MKIQRLKPSVHPLDGGHSNPMIEMSVADFRKVAKASHGFIPYPGDETPPDDVCFAASKSFLDSHGIEIIPIQK